ncbi:hypothetical protein AYX14_02772 [Cryptococcus neoformans]|nr:hypothetical protein AYX15_04077 [Cryptococcus neoformans var. grubii]OWZ71790.1 hypothetical protein AYX14_02772 [Cryptococcus neoformans var. grubii]
MSNIIEFSAPSSRSSSSKTRNFVSPSTRLSKTLCIEKPFENINGNHEVESHIYKDEDVMEEDIMGEESMLVDTDQEEDSDADEEKEVIHVEVRQKSFSHLREQPIMQIVTQFIQEDLARVELGCELSGWNDIKVLRDHVERIWVEEGGVASVQVPEVDIQVHVYKASLNNEVEDFSADLDDDDSEEKVSAASVRTLPSAELDGIWDTLVYSDDIKARLLNYIYSTILFSESDIDFNVIAWNRVILLHGPPGTGKTSLCRALAQKMSIRLSQKYRHGKIIEINSHSLFSKWFSESGKLVQKLFQTVTEMVEDESGFVVVMIDEVESLTAARASAMKGNEPSDSLRVVNALLTQLDKLRTRKNVLVVTTSNLVDAIDEAFISRVDLLESVPLPPPRAIYSILSGCLKECITKRLIKRCRILDWKAAEEAQRERKFAGEVSVAEKGKEAREVRERGVAASLADLAVRCHAIELSGRTLRKLPVIAHARHLSSSSSSTSSMGEYRSLKVERWIEAMHKVVDVEQEKKQGLARGGSTLDAGGGETLTRRDGINGHAEAHGYGHAYMEKNEVGMMVGTKVKH